MRELKVKQLVELCNQNNASILSYNIKRDYKGTDLYVAIVKFDNRELVTTLTYNEALEVWQ